MNKKIFTTLPQAQFHALECKYPAFVGGFGSGKTETMINQAIIDACAHKDALIAIYEPSYDLIRTLAAPRLKEKLYMMGIEFEENKTWNTITTNSNIIGNFILRSLDSPERIVGYESYRAHIDEIDTLKKEQAEMAWNKIIARNRQRLPIKKQLNRVCAYSTPEGFNFLYERWVKNKIDGYELVQAETASNPFLPKDYIESLYNTYPAELIKAYLKGLFVNLKSGTVYKSFNRKVNNSSEIYEDGEDIFVGCDFNITKMAAAIFVKRLSEWHCVGEIINAYDTDAVIKLIKERYSKSKVYVYPDASGKSRHPSKPGQSDISLLEQAKFFIRCRTKNPYIKDRVNAVNKAFEDKKIFVNVEQCPNITDTLEQQVYDKSGLPNKANDKDHPNDAFGYFVAYEMPVNKPVAQINLKF